MFINTTITDLPVAWNANLKHYLTPFGYSVEAHLYLQANNRKLFFTLHNYANKNRSFPGVSIELLSQPKTFAKLRTYNTIAVSLWSQPKDLSFTTSDSKWGGRVSLHIEQHWSKTYQTYVELNYKTQGWYAGELYLTESTNLMFGIKLQVGS